MQQYLVEEELEHYRDGWISRREFIRRAALLGIGGAVAAGLAATVHPRPAATAPVAQMSPYHVPEGDPSVETDRIWYSSNDETPIYAYRAWPAGARMDHSYPGVVVCHENQGLVPYIEDVGRRFAREGYIAIAPDLVSRVGPPRHELTEDQGRAAFGSLNAGQMAKDLADALDLLAGHDAVDATKLAATGYCAGSSVIWLLATLAPQLRAAAPFYGSAPPLDAVPNIRAAMFGVYGDLDERVNATIPALDEALQAAGVTYRMKMYPNSAHGFHRDTDSRVYNPETAAEAWQDKLAWFAEHLGLAS